VTRHELHYNDHRIQPQILTEATGNDGRQASLGLYETTNTSLIQKQSFCAFRVLKFDYALRARCSFFYLTHERSIIELSVQRYAVTLAISSRSTDVVALRISEWIAATPLMVWLPTMHRWAMLIFFSPPSSMIDMRRRRSMSPGQRFATSCSVIC